MDKKHSLHNRPDINNGATEKKTQQKRVRKLSQSNHHDYRLPAGMECREGEPLYLAISRWCLKEGRWISLGDIALAFGLQPRRASYQMSYITRKPGRVVCLTRFIPDESTRRPRCEIRVERILVAPPDPRRGSEPAAEGRGMPGMRRTRVGNAMAGSGRLWDALLRDVRKGHDDD